MRIKMNSYLYLLILTFSFVQSSNITASEIPELFEHAFYINEIKTETDLSQDQKFEFENLDLDLTKDFTSKDELTYYHILQDVDNATSELILEDGSRWVIGWWYSGRIKEWQAGDRLKISFHLNSMYPNKVEIINVDQSQTAWGDILKVSDLGKEEEIARIPNGPFDPDQYKKVILQSGWVFVHVQQLAGNWNVNDKVFIFHNISDKNKYDLWNQTKGQFYDNWTLVKNEKPGTSDQIHLKNLLELENRLNQRVLAQPEASEAVTASLLNYGVGLKDPKTPVGVFLFLGPTGVGKTEMAKVLADEIYKTQERLIRFDMSHFSETHSTVRLLGSPPGYVNHEEGGQLTEALKAKSHSIVLLDEIEKAHPAVRKIFLPVFDEGYVTDSKDIKVLCNNAVFIMTSNLCAQQISDFFYMGYEADEILQAIEPQLLAALSPELYNRVEPIVFRPLGEETIDRLVDLMLRDVVKMLWSKKSIHLTIDDSVREYLCIHGFNPALGARPLKKLIQKKVSASLSFAIIKESIPDGSSMNLFYLPKDDSWHVNWSE